MKRILIFSVAYHPFVGGAEIAIKEITDRIPGIEFEMITANLDGRQKSFEKMGNVFVHRVGSGVFSKWLLPFLGYIKAQKLHRQKPFDVVWSIMANQAGVAAARFSKRAALPLILTVQEGDEEEYLMRYVGGSTLLYRILIRPFHRLPFRRSSLITVISNYLRARSERSGAKCPIKIIPNGVDIRVFGANVASSDIEKTKVELSKKDDDVLLITTSRLVEKNGIQDVISALALLPINVRFVILGTGHLESRLKAHARSMGVESRVVFIGAVAHNDIPRYLAVSDIFIRPSLSEGMGNSFIEAMAAGKPVIGTPVGGIPDFLVDEETGLFCEVRNPRSIAEKVTWLLENVSERDRIVAHARTVAAERYSWDMIAMRMKTEIFDTVTI